MRREEGGRERKEIGRGRKGRRIYKPGMGSERS